MCIYQKIGKVIVTNCNILENVGPEHDVNGMDKMVDIIPILVEIESVYIHSGWVQFYLT